MSMLETITSYISNTIELEHWFVWTTLKSTIVAYVLSE